MDDLLPTKDFEKAATALKELLKTVADLRDPQTGCPWDLEQNFESLRKYMLEEAYEASQAMASKISSDICDELGDVLLQVVLNSQIASEEKLFSIADVINNLKDKIIRRHPHVFANIHVKDSEEVIKNWEAIKAEEKNQEKSKIAKAIFPANAQSYKFGKIAYEVGFDWPTPQRVFEQVTSEIKELNVAIKDNDKASIKDEIGDVFFSLVQLCRHFKLDPEVTHQDANLKFEKRYTKMLELAAQQNKEFKSLALEEKESLWQEAKKITQ